MTLETSGRVVCLEESISVSHDRQQSAKRGHKTKATFGTIFWSNAYENPDELNRNIVPPSKCGGL